MRLRFLPLLALLACGPRPAPSPPSPAASAAPSAVVSAPVAVPDTPEAMLDAWLERRPGWGRTIGLRKYDGRVPDYSRAGLDAHQAWLEAVMRKLEGEGRGDSNRALDRAILRSRARLEHFDLAERRRPYTDPRFYTGLFDVSTYIDFAYAPAAQRMARVVDHEKAALEQVDHILKNLDPVLSRPVVETAIKAYRGYAAYLRDDVPKVVAALKDAELDAAFAKTNGVLAQAAADIADRLEKDWLPRASADAHVLGTERYLAFVEAQEGRRYELAEFRAIADADLKRNRDAYLALKDRVKVKRPDKTALIAEAEKLIERSRSFIVDKGLVSIPSDDACTVKETPPYMRYNAAFLNMAGPYDPAREAYYYITLPDPTWPAAEQEAYIFPYGVLMSTSVHEVYPGHFLHGLWIRKAKTRIQRVGESYSFTEGWAHYTEQLMVEEGFGEDDPQNRLGQLSDALLRNCRFVASIGMHTGEMNLDQVAALFETQCFQDKATAREQAVRATFDPGFFAYTLGKLQILELRERLKSELGDAFSLKAFHDALLGFGAPPVALIADRVAQQLKDGAAKRP